MDYSWTHFFAESTLQRSEQESERTFRSEQCSTNTLPHTSYELQPGCAAVDHRRLPHRQLGQGMTQGTSSKMGCLPPNTPVPPAEQSFPTQVDPSQIPRRNLTEAFEELYIEPEETTMPPNKNCIDASHSNPIVISPTAVTDLNMERRLLVETRDDANPSSTSTLSADTPTANEYLVDENDLSVPYFYLHPDLKRELSQAVVNRVSFYGVIHDINKEASTMAANDDSCYHQDEACETSPIVAAATGSIKSTPSVTDSMAETALIDEERWLLAAIESRGADESRPLQGCPSTFLQAMGEREYDNPSNANTAFRTQLWKPSRSWWEAKSGKNPWIEPKSHNKRWRYLWPLIHFHKFLAKCIKKLKRNGVDVKTSVSPVCVFLREEVCAVSDHLAAVSMFDSDEWMSCLIHFEGWTDQSPKAIVRLRSLVSKQKLRALSEPRDVDSPLLRSQIDEQFLRAMAAARQSMVVGTQLDERRKGSKEPSRPAEDQIRDDSQPTSVQLPAGLPPVYPCNPTNSVPVPKQVDGQSPTGGMRRPRWGYPHPGQWWGHGWVHPPQYPYGDDTSVHSALSGDSYSQFYNEYGVYPGSMPTAPVYPPLLQPHNAPSETSDTSNGGVEAGYDPSYYPTIDPYSTNHSMTSAPVWHMANQNVAYSDGTNYVMHPGTPCVPGTPHGAPVMYQPTTVEESTDYNNAQGSEFYHQGEHTSYDPMHMPMSPFWGHLDHMTLAMMGLATPQGHKAPLTPSRKGHVRTGVSERSNADQPNKEGEEKEGEGHNNSQPLLLRQSHYFGFGTYGAREGYPSPATQFMMSPQANFAYGYGYGFSPRRPSTQKKRVSKRSPPSSEKNQLSTIGNETVEKETIDVTPPPTVRKLSSDRASPATVETLAESDSVIA